LIVCCFISSKNPNFAQTFSISLAMKKIFFFFLLTLCVQILPAQRSAFFISENKLFYEGKTMFNDGNYAGCIDKLKEFIKTDPESSLLRESEFLLIASDYRQGKKDVLQSLRDYLEENPGTIHRDDISFMIGSIFFERKDYPHAIFWFNQTNIDNLSNSDQEDYAYRMAFSSMQEGKYDEAYRLFKLLNQNSEKYRDVSTYYLATIYFSKKDYDTALQLFNQLKGKPEFESEVLFHAIQIHFAQGRFSQTIKNGKEFLAAFPDNDRIPEVNRVIGISYYEEENFAEAIRYLLPYIQAAESPSRKDYYQLGISLFHTRRFNEAIQYLGRSVSMNDAIGQSANMFLGQAYLETGNQKNALMAFEAASSVNFDLNVKEAAMYNYAILLYKTSNSAFGESVTVLENFLNTFPNSIYADRVNDRLIEVYFTTKNYNVALESINRIKNPGRRILEAKQKIYYHLGTIEFTNTQFETAIDYFTKAINLGNYAPLEKALSAYWRGESYFRLNKFDEAIRDFQSFRDSGVKSGDLSALVLYNLGYSYFNKRQFSTALNFFSSYINQETDTSKMTLADAYARLGDCHFENRNFTAAENAYAKAATLQPSMADYVIYQRGFILGLQKNQRGKIEQMDKLIKSFPDSRLVPDALYEKGRAYVMLDDSKSAISIFNLLWDKYPDSHFARKAGLQIGLLYFNLKELQQSAAAYKRVITKYPGSEEAKVALQDLKSVYVDLGDIEGFAKYVNSLGGAAKFDISEQDSLTYLSAERLFSSGNTAQAQAALKKYIQSFPNGGFVNKAHFYLGNIYLSQGQTALAKVEFENVLKLGSNAFTENALVHLADIQFKEKDFASALTNYTKLSSIASSKANIHTGLLGVIRSASALKKYADVLNAASSLLKESNLSPEIVTEAKYFQAKAYIALNEPNKAMPILKEIAKDTRTVFGAEAKYLVAQLYYDSKQYDLAEAEILNYIKVGTPHSYWLARGFILLSDVYVAKNDNLQARQYLESLKQNYKQSDDIQEMINERLRKLKIES
jgi:TolA-binding protein